MPKSNLTPGKAGPGRPKGSKNKVPAAVKDMILEALSKAHKEGAVAYLVEQAGENPVAFMSLVGKVLPLDVYTEHSGQVVAQVVFKGLNG